MRWRSTGADGQSAIKGSITIGEPIFHGEFRILKGDDVVPGYDRHSNCRREGRVGSSSESYICGSLFDIDRDINKERCTTAGLWKLWIKSRDHAMYGYRKQPAS